MSAIAPLISDLAIILVAAGCSTLVFKGLRQPVILGYIVAGVLAGPSVSFIPTISDASSIRVWADIGVIFLLFAMGLEFSFRKLLSVGGTAVTAAVTIVAGMMFVGYGTGMSLGFSHMSSIFLGGMLSMSSTAIVFKAFDDMGLRGQRFTGVVLGILVVEDLVGVVLMVLLSTLAVSKQFEGAEMLGSILKLGAFLIFWSLLGIYLIPTLLKRLQRLLNDETLLIVALGLCLGMVMIAVKAGFSAALGAFVMGSLLAETVAAERITRLVEPVKNLFGAIFFVSVGMMIEPALLVRYAGPIVLLTVVVLAGQATFATLGVLAPMLEGMWNYDLGTAMAWEDGAWSGGYLIVMALISRLEAFPQMYAVKLFDMACQTAAALAVLKLALTRGAKPGAAVGAMLACVLAPTMLLSAGCWAQCDAMFAALALWGLALLLKDHPVWGCILWGLAAATKLQAGFLFPLLLVFFMKGRVSIRHLLAGLAAFVLAQAAFLLDGQGLTAVFGRYAQQIEAISYEGAGLADHAPGVYSLMTVASVREFSGMGMYLAFASALLVAFALIHARREPDADTLLLAALLLAAGLPLILPQMNARCLYLAGMLAFACVNGTRRLAIAIVLELISLCSYMEAIFSFTVIPMNVLSLLAIACAAALALELMGKLGIKGAQIGESDA